MDLDRKEANLIEKLREIKNERIQLCTPNVFPCIKCPDILEHVKLILTKLQLEELQQILIHQTSTHSMSEEAEGRLKVLRTLEYIDRQNLVQLKGKVACEISHQELLISELILDNKFHDRSPPEIAALFSAFTCQHGGKNNNNNLIKRNIYNNKNLKNLQINENNEGKEEELIERVPGEILKENLM
ncbi:hypothetical protein Mgra_00007080 [Meloidogyne graminicola]|uniref:ATP-dependent RNA helicase Ski2/MTR4 C-terminal domain-containing protein n=1 Tax=Meloidogyne graminicola TaxID=189291 RepID=A0A8S9ZJM1_9BILA|nr:hypothetical protein Mgra_00007080 [Meloidogyne graminicola]